jgi:hypothetical protein
VKAKTTLGMEDCGMPAQRKNGENAKANSRYVLIFVDGDHANIDACTWTLSPVFVGTVPY